METPQSTPAQKPVGALRLIDNESSVTEVVRQAMAQTEDPRLRTVMAALV